MHATVCLVSRIVLRHQQHVPLIDLETRWAHGNSDTAGPGQHRARPAGRPLRHAGRQDRVRRRRRARPGVPALGRHRRRRIRGGDPRGAQLDDHDVRLALRADQRRLPALLGVPRLLPLRQHQARPRRLRAGVLDVLVGLDDVRDRHGHRADVLRRRRAAVAPGDPAPRPGRGGLGAGCAARDGVHVLPLGLPPLGDVRRHRPLDRLLRLPQGLRQPRVRRLHPAPRCARQAGSRQGHRRGRDLRDALRLGDVAGPGRPADHRRAGRGVRPGAGQQVARHRRDRGPHRRAS